MEKTSKKEALKSILAVVGGAGCWEVVHNIVAHTTPSGIGFFGKALVLIGSTVLTGMASDAAETYISDKVDKGVEALAKLQEESEDSEEEESA